MIVTFQKGKITGKVFRNSYKGVCGLVMHVIMRGLESSVRSICLSEDSNVI